MVVLKGHLRPEIAQMMRGHIDFYYWRGLLVARTWPRKPLFARSAAVQQSAQNFADTIKVASNYPSPLLAQVTAQTQGTDWTWRDLLINAAYGGHVIAP